MSLESFDFVLTDSFVDYGFDSTDPIRNLQIMFILIVFCALFPIFSLCMRGLCCCCDRGKSFVTRMNKVMYFNTYVRIGLEAYLELSISALIRFKEFKFNS